MPPRAKFTQKQVVDAALEIVETQGLEKLTARNLAEKLGSSARPIFTAFDNMEQVIGLTIQKADEIYRGYVEKGLKAPLPFKGVGESYVRFACEHPRLFQLLFMQERDGAHNTQNVLQGIESSYDEILQSIVTSYGVSRETAQRLYLNIWIYTHGIAVLTATKVCEFSEKQISDMLTVVFTSLLVREKKGELQ